MAFTKINAAGIGTTETVTVDGLTVINNGSFGGNLTVSGVLTYEDVTNVDSVGLITARNGVVVGSGITLSKDGDIFATGITTVSGNVKVGTGITLSPDGDVFFTGVGTGNGSGLTALNASNLASGTVPTARLGSGTASSSTFLRGDSTFATVTSTTISGNGDNKLITGSGTANTLTAEADLTFDGTNLKLTDHKNMYFGTGNDLRIWHDANNSYSQISGQSYSLYIDGATTYMRTSDGSSGVENAIVMNSNGSVDLYHSGTKKFETTSTGASITGVLDLSSHLDMGDSDMIKLGDSDDLLIYHNGSLNLIDVYTNNLQIRNESSETMAVFNRNGAVQLYHDGDLHLETHANGAQVKNQGADTSFYLTAADGYSAQIQFLADNGDDYADMSRIYKDQSGGKFHFQNYADGAWENNLVCDNSGAVRLYHNNTEYAKTFSAGLQIGLKARNDDYNHISTIGWAISDGWTKVVFNNSVGGNTPLTIYNEHSNFNRYMVYFKFNGGIANYQSEDTDLCDERAKKDFADVSSQWDNIKNIGLKHFRYQEDSSSEPLKIGVVAQQVETVYPDLVQEDWPQGDANPNTGEGTFYKSVKEQQLLMYAIKALQEAQARIETLEAEVAALKGS